MKKLLITITLAILGTLTYSSASAQFNLGGGLAFNRFGGDYGKMHPAINPRIGYMFSAAKIFVEIGYNYSPVAGKKLYPIYAVNNEGFEMKASITQKVGINNLYAHWGRILGNPENDFYFRLFTGISLDYLSLKYSASAPQGYEVPELEDEKLEGIKIDLGFGTEYKLNEKGYVYAELVLGLPATHVNEIAVPNPTVMHYGVSIGYKIYIGGRDNIDFGGPGASPWSGRRGFF